MAISLLIVTCAMAMFIAGTTWPALRENAEANAKTKRVEPGPGGSPVMSRPAPPESLEGVLVAQLADRVITPDQYRRAMEFVAARDVESS